jgi:hypothetical protein
MKLVNKAIVSRLRDVVSDLNGRVYGALLPQGSSYPAALVRVTGIEFTHSMSTRMANDTYYVMVAVYSFDMEEAADLAVQVRNALDKPLGFVAKDIVVATCVPQNGEENAFLEDETEIFTWQINFMCRVHSTC